MKHDADESSFGICAQNNPLLRRDTSQRQSRIEHFRRVRHPLKELQRARFGRSSERLDPDQLQLALEEVERALAQAESEIKNLLHCAAEPRSRARTSVNPCPHIRHASRSSSSRRTRPVDAAKGRCM
jgi:Transposase C of IS166 homeodomain